MNCPHCNAEIHVISMATIPAEQTISMELTRKDSGMFTADTLGHVLLNFDEAMKATAKSIGGKVAVFVADVVRSGDKTRIDFFVAEVAAGKKA
jgi:hypothetical protein